MAIWATACGRVAYVGAGTITTAYRILPLPLLEPALDAGTAELKLAADFHAEGKFRAMVEPRWADAQELRRGLDVEQVAIGGSFQRRPLAHLGEPGGNGRQHRECVGGVKCTNGTQELGEVHFAYLEP
jgi:hypothetical protein